MNPVLNLSVSDMAQGFLMLAVPLGFFFLYRIRMIGDVLFSLIRMILQLGFVAFYLGRLFTANNAVLNFLWLAAMLFTGVMTTLNRLMLNRKLFLLPLLFSGFTALLIIDVFFLGFSLKLKNFFDAQYFIPITGMVLGNTLNYTIVALGSYFRALREKQELYHFILINTANPKIALRPFIREAVQKGLNPLLASVSVTGLISLPGMMTGQILGGSPPLTAIKYQIMISLAIFTGCTVNLFAGIILSNLFIFDPYARLKKNLFRMPRSDSSGRSSEGSK